MNTNDNKTLRDEFAMAALTGILANLYDEIVDIKNVAESAYAVANQMMEQRKK